MIEMKKIPEFPKSDYEDTLVYAIQKGKKDGYVHEFRYDDGHLWIDDKSYARHSIKIDGMIRFEGMSNPADSMIYYRLSTTEGRKGYFVSAFGINANASALQFLAQTVEN